MSRTSVKEIVKNVRTGVRNVDDLKRCGCAECLKALEYLEPTWETTVHRDGGGVGVHVPRAAADRLGVDVGDRVRVYLRRVR